MRKEIVNEKLDKLERATGLKSDGVVIFHKPAPDGYGSNKYTYEERSGERVYYQNGLELTKEKMKELRRNSKIIVDDI